jgi:hypothetical protein
MIETGSASTVITNKLGTHIQGAAVGGKAKYVRDDLEAGAFCLKRGNTTVMFVSCDLGGLEPGFTVEARNAMAEKTGLSPRSIIIGGTHTGGPSVLPTNYQKTIDLEYLEFLKVKLVDLADRALNSLQPSRLGVSGGHAKIGYNRRCCLEDGTHNMGRNTQLPLKYTGMEGPDDHDQFVLYAVDGSDNITAVLHQNTSHPCTFYGADFYSADYPGLARKHIRNVLGEIPVLFFNGAFGDIGQDKMDTEPFAVNKEMKLNRCALPLAGETLRLIYENPPKEDLILQHLYEDISVKVRLPSQETLCHAKNILSQVDSGKSIPPMEIVFAHGASLLQKRFGKKSEDILPIHVIRIGHAAIVTQPTELFCQFGLDIKRRSPFSLTSVFSICDGYSGYCPTYDAVISGGYSGKPIYWTRFSPETGYKIVDEACRLLFSLNQES